MLVQREHRTGSRFFGVLRTGAAVGTARLLVFAIDLDGRRLYRLPREAPGPG